MTRGKREKKVERSEGKEAVGRERGVSFFFLHCFLGGELGGGRRLRGSGGREDKMRWDEIGGFC